MFDLPPFDKAPAIVRPAPDGYARNKSGLLVPRDAGMPGMFNPMLMGGAAPSKFAFRDYALSNSAGKVTVPATVQAGDLLVHVDGVQNTNGNFPSGFTTIINSGAQSFIWHLSYKLATGAEAGVQLTGQTSTSPGTYSVVGMLLAFSGNFSSYQPNTFLYSLRTTSNPPSRTVAAAGVAEPLIVFGFYHASTSITTRTFSPAEDAEIVYSSLMYMKYKIYNSGPQDTTIDMADYGTNTMMAGYIKGI